MGHHVELEVAELFPLVFRGDCSVCVEHLDPNKRVRQVLCKEREANKIDQLVHKGRRWSGEAESACFVLCMCVLCVCAPKRSAFQTKLKPYVQQDVCYLQRCEEWSVDGETESHNWEWLGGGGWLTVMLGTKCWKGSLVQKQKQEGEVRRQHSRYKSSIGILKTLSPIFMASMLILLSFTYTSNGKRTQYKYQAMHRILSTFLSTD